MKHIFIILFSILLLSGCKRTQEQLAEDIIVRAMTDGRWTVTVYNNGTDLSSSFSGYSFQFKSNRTVDAIRNAAVESSGTWQGDGLARTIQSAFPANAPAALKQLDGLWRITNNNWTWVQATQTINGTLTTLELRKL